MDLFELAAKQAAQETDGAPVQPPAAPPAEAPAPVDSTKAYAERLKNDRAKIREELQNELAQSMGYKTWNELTSANQTKVITDAGLDVEKVKPIIEQLIKNDPTVIAAKASLAAQETNAREEKERADLLELNKRYGTQFRTLDDVDEASMALYKQGVPLVKAYGVEHYDELIKTQGQNVPSKSHMSVPPASGGSTQHTPGHVSADEMKVFKLINPHASDDEIRKYIANQNK